MAGVEDVGRTVDEHVVVERIVIGQHEHGTGSGDFVRRGPDALDAGVDVGLHHEGGAHPCSEQEQSLE